jgi:hypothetical protein
MFNRTQLLIGILVFENILQYRALQEMVKENIRRGQLIDYFIGMLDKHDVEFDEFDVIALSDFGVKFKEIDATTG